MSHLDRELASLIKIAKIAILIAIVAAYALGSKWISCNTEEIFPDLSNAITPKASGSEHMPNTANVNSEKDGAQMSNMGTLKKSSKRVKLFHEWYDTKIHKYRDGQDYLTIGEYYGVDYNLIRAANAGKSARSFKQGQDVFIPIMN
jgi:hypothetical protein